MNKIEVTDLTIDHAEIVDISTLRTTALPIDATAMITVSCEVFKL